MGPQSPVSEQLPSCLNTPSEQPPSCLKSRQPKTELERIWVFGYGSLCWRPGFPYEERCIGRVEGYTRRFWQGSVTHRGTPEKPGRVATLVEQRRGTTWGCAFHITDPAALSYLHGREVALGGYQARQVAFEPREAGQSPFTVTVYLAAEDNPFWLGEAPLGLLATQVAAASGRCGPNADYVLQLVHFMKRYIPEECDTHLFDLAALVEAAVSGAISPASIGAISPTADDAISPPPSGAISPGAGGTISSPPSGDSSPTVGGAISPTADTTASPVKPNTGAWRRRCSHEVQDDARSTESASEPACRCR